MRVNERAAQGICKAKRGAAALLLVFSLVGIMGAGAVAPQEAFANEAPAAQGAVSATEIQKAQSALSARFARGGADRAIDNGAFCAALALNMEGNGAKVDTASVLNSLKKAKTGEYFSGGTYAKYILALSAGGYDCSAMVGEMEQLIDTNSMDVWSASSILPVYRIYEPGIDGIKDILVNCIVDAQNEAGLMGGYGYFDTQTTAQGILALLPYQDKEFVATTIAKAKTGIDKLALSNGGFAYEKGQDKANLDATAWIVTAYAAMGEDCDASLRYLLDASDKGDGASYEGVTYANEPWTAAAAFAAFSASRASAAKASIYDLGKVTPTIAGKTVTYNGKAALAPAVYGTSAKPTVTYYTDSACTKKVSSCVNAGTYYAKIAVAGTTVSNQTRAVVKLTIKKAAQKVGLKKASAAKKYSAAKKGAYKGKLSKTRSISAKTVSKTFGISSKGSLSFSRSAVSKKAGKHLKVSRSGAVSVKKGLKKGTYTLKIKVSAKGTANYNAAPVRTISYKVKVV